MTNADLIRAMSDEELARALSNTCVNCVIKECRLHNYGSVGCENRYLEWLRRPAEGGEQDGAD